MPWWAWSLLGGWMFGPALLLFVGVKWVNRLSDRQKREAQQWAYWDGQFNEEGRVWQR